MPFDFVSGLESPFLMPRRESFRIVVYTSGGVNHVFASQAIALHPDL